MKLFTKYQRLIPVFIAGLGLLFSCTKQKTPVPVVPEPTKWEKIAGHYKVYDTTGVYLYEMDLVHIHNDAVNRDSIRFENFDGEFTFTTQQEVASNAPMNISIGVHNLLYDSNSKRWRIFGPSYLDYNNFSNDTINLRFDKTNINSFRNRHDNSVRSCMGYIESWLLCYWNIPHLQKRRYSEHNCPVKNK